VQAERLIADDQRDFRNFDGDGFGKDHFGQGTSIFYPSQLTSPNCNVREDVEFLWRGFKKIHRLVERLQRGRGCHQGVEVHPHLRQSFFQFPFTFEEHNILNFITPIECC
jgi:hypothetical protein